MLLRAVQSQPVACFKVGIGSLTFTPVRPPEGAGPAARPLGQITICDQTHGAPSVHGVPRLLTRQQVCTVYFPGFFTPNRYRAEPGRSVGPPAAPTPPAAMGRSLATPPAATTPPAASARSLATLPAAII